MYLFFLIKAITITPFSIHEKLWFLKIQFIPYLYQYNKVRIANIFLVVLQGHENNVPKRRLPINDLQM